MRSLLPIASVLFMVAAAAPAKAQQYEVFACDGRYGRSYYRVGPGQFWIYMPSQYGIPASWGDYNACDYTPYTTCTWENGVHTRTIRYPEEADFVARFDTINGTYGFGVPRNGTWETERCSRSAPPP